MPAERALQTSGGLWTLIVSPTVWAVHFTLCYAVAAVYCAKAGGGQAADLLPVRAWIAAVTVAALAIILWSGHRALRQWGAGAVDPPHDAATLADRRRFFGLATLLLAGLSCVATLYVALPALFIGDCR